MIVLHISMSSLFPQYEELVELIKKGKVEEFKKKLESISQNVYLEARGTAAFLSDEESNLLLAMANENLDIYDVKSEKKLREIKSENKVTSVAFSTDCDFIAIGDLEGVVRVFDVFTKKKLRQFKVNDTVYSLAFSNHKGFSAYRLAVGDKSLHIYDLKYMNKVHEFKHGVPIYSVTFSSDNSMVATGDEAFKTTIYNLEKEKKHEFEHDGAVYSVSFSSDDTMLATGDNANKTRIYDIVKKTIDKEFDHNSSVLSVAFSNDGSMVVAGDYAGETRLYAGNSSELLYSMPKKSPVWIVKFSNDGSVIVSVSDDKTYVYDLDQRSAVKKINKGSRYASVGFNFNIAYEFRYQYAKDMQDQVQLYDEMKFGQGRESRNIKPNLMDDNGVSLLQRAVQFKRPKIVDYLIKMGADVSYASREQSIISYLVLCDPTVIARKKKGKDGKDDYYIQSIEKRFKETAKIINAAMSQEIKKNIYCNPALVETYIRQIELNEEDEEFEEEFGKEYECKKIKSWLRECIPDIVLDKTESETLQFLLTIESPRNPLYLFYKILEDFHNKCKAHLDSRPVEIFKENTQQVIENELKQFQDEANQIEGYLILLRKHQNWLMHQSYLNRFAIRSFFLSHLKAYVQEPKSRDYNYDTTFHSGETLYTAFLFTDEEIKYHTMLFRKQKLQILIANKYMVTDVTNGYPSGTDLSDNAFLACLSCFEEKFDRNAEYKYKWECLKVMMDIDKDVFNPLKYSDGLFQFFYLYIGIFLRLNEIRQIGEELDKSSIMKSKAFFNLLCYELTEQILNNPDHFNQFKAISKDDQVKTIMETLRYVDVKFDSGIGRTYYDVLLGAQSNLDIRKKILDMYILLYKCGKTSNTKRKREVQIKF